jgi:[ribosomal protein S5]-alanine N-acetyltransferase
MQEAAATRDGLVERADRPCDHPSMDAIEQSTLETSRLRLRPLEMTDAEALNVIQSDPVHMRFYPHPFSLEESREWIDRMRERRERDGFSLLAVEDRETGEFLGNVGPILQHVDGVDEVELGWSITPARARQGIATEAALACRDWAFAALPLGHLISLILPDNVPSRGVAEHLGMTVWKDVMWGTEKPQLHFVYRVDRPAEAAVRG